MKNSCTNLFVFEQFLCTFARSKGNMIWNHFNG